MRCLLQQSDKNPMDTANKESKKLSILCLKPHRETVNNKASFSHKKPS